MYTWSRKDQIPPWGFMANICDRIVPALSHTQSLGGRDRNPLPVRSTPNSLHYFTGKRLCSGGKNKLPGKAFTRSIIFARVHVRNIHHSMFFAYIMHRTTLALSVLLYLARSDWTSTRPSKTHVGVCGWVQDKEQPRNATPLPVWRNIFWFVRHQRHLVRCKIRVCAYGEKPVR